MHAKREQQKQEKTALNISLIGGAVFVILEILMAIHTASQAVLLDSVYDGVELFMVLISISLVPLLYRSSNEKHPFGYLQVESLFVVIKGFTMAAVTIGLILNNLEIALHGGRHVDFSQVAYFELFASILSVFVIFILRRFNDKVNSPIVTMEIQSWQIDVIASFGMAVAFFLPQFIKASWFLPLTPYLDQVITIVLSLFILPAPIRSVLTGLRDLFLLAPEEETVEHIKSIITPILDAYGYDKLYYDIVRTGRKLWISVYITFDRDEISISRFKIVQNFIIQALKNEYQDFYFELLPDVEFTEHTETS